MSFSFPSSGGWDPASQQTVGWRGRSTRHAVRGEAAVPAENWARLRAAASTSLPVSAPGPGASSAPRHPLETEESALIATQQFAQGERESKLRASLERLTSTTRATRTGIETVASAVRAQSGAAERRTRGLVDEIGKVRRAVHAADARREIAKSGERTLETVREVLKSFVGAQEKAKKAGERDVEERVARAEVAVKEVREWQRMQSDRLGRMEDALNELLRQGRRERTGQGERLGQREIVGMLTRQRLRVQKESMPDDGSASGREESRLAKQGGRDRKRKGDVGKGRYVRQRVARTTDSSLALSMDSSLGLSDTSRKGIVSVRNDGNRKDEDGQDDSMFAESNVDRDSAPHPPSAPGSSPVLPPWMWESGGNDQDKAEECMSIPCVVRRKKPVSVKNR